MDERSIILNAIKNKDSTPIDFDFPEPDAIEKWAKRKRRQESFRQKNIVDWTNADFLNYLDHMLKDFGAVRLKLNMRTDSNTLDLVHDKLVKYIQEVSNAVLREYMEWWCSIWAPRMTGKELYLRSMLQDQQIKRFSTRYTNRKSEEQILPIASTVINDAQIYDLGGLDLLVMKQGIVAGYRLMKKRPANPDEVMQQTLSHFNKDTLTTVMNVTFENSPYPSEDKIDFIELAKPFLEAQGLDTSHKSHEHYFRSD